MGNEIIKRNWFQILTIIIRIYDLDNVVASFIGHSSSGET